MKYITIVLEYEKGQSQPTFCADMSLLGGRVTAVMFDDALKQLEIAEDKLEEIKINGDC